MSAVLIQAGAGSRDAFGIWVAAPSIETNVKLSEAPVIAESDHQTDATRRDEQATFFLTGRNAEPLRTGAMRSSADRIRWNGATWTIKNIRDYGDLVSIIADWEDPQADGPGYQDNDIDRAVRQLVAQASGLLGNVVIPGNSPGPSPDTLFATVLRMTDVQQGWPVEYENDVLGDHILDTRSNRYATFAVQWYRSGAQAVGSRALEWLGTSLAADFASALGLRIHRYNDLRDLDAIVASEWEERWGMDLELAFFADRRWDSSCISSAPFEVMIQ